MACRRDDLECETPRERRETRLDRTRQPDRDAPARVRQGKRPGRAAMGDEPSRRERPRRVDVAERGDRAGAGERLGTPDVRDAGASEKLPLTSPFKAT
jgi:hypothetical protein